DRLPSVRLPKPPHQYVLCFLRRSDARGAGRSAATASGTRRLGATTGGAAATTTATRLGCASPRRSVGTGRSTSWTTRLGPTPRSATGSASWRAELLLRTGAGRLAPAGTQSVRRHHGTRSERRRSLRGASSRSAPARRLWSARRDAD